MMYFGQIYKVASRRIVGGIQSTTLEDVTTQAQNDPDLAVAVAGQLLDTNSFWVNAEKQIVAREPVTLNPDKTDIAADDAEVATISGLPDPCWISNNGVELQVTGGSYLVRSASPQMIRLELIGQYQGGPWMISAYDVAAFKTQAKDNIDAAAEVCRLKYITAGSGQAMVYQAKASEAGAYIAAANPAEADYPLLAAEAAATGSSLLDLARNVVATAAQWTALAATIEARRLKAKQLVDNAATIAGIKAAMDIGWP